jgi:hypothetical protein
MLCGVLDIWICTIRHYFKPHYSVSNVVARAHLRLARSNPSQPILLRKMKYIIEEELFLWNLYTPELASLV